MMTLSFSGWNGIKAVKDRAAVRNWTREVAKEATDAFKRGSFGSHSGNIGRRANGSIFQRSTPKEFPAVDSGSLIRSLRGLSNADSATIGTNVPHSIFLRRGTRFMKRRKMSDNALQIGIKKTRGKLKWIKWQPL